MSAQSLVRVTLAALIVAALPAIARAQSPDQTVCKDGTSSKQTGSNACDGHGGIDDLKTAMLRRKRVLMGEPKQAGGESRTSDAATKATPAPPRAPATEAHDEPRVSQAGTPSDDGRARGHVRPKNAVARCRDGTYDYGRGKKTRNICKHHGGIGRWYGR